MSRNKIGLCLVGSILLIWSFVFSIEQESSPTDVKIIANYWERIKDRIIATGNVEIHYKNIIVLADWVDLNTETKDIYAEGNVSLKLPEEELSCEEMSFNLDSSEGELKKVFGMIQPSIFYEADSIERKNESVYSFKKARITSCTQRIPRWNFSCSRANFKKDDYMEMWNTVFSIKKIPVFYLPYLRYPLDKERSTGFLTPQLGYSGPKGFVFSEVFYWSIRRNMDASFNLDYYSLRGLGGGLEYRYLFSEGTGGQLDLYYFNFKKIPEQESPENAYLFRFKHNQPLPFNLNLVADVDYQSSYDFLREFDNNFRRAVVSNRRSQVYLSRAWSYFNLSVRISRFETYFTQMKNSIIKRNLPEIGFSSSKIKIFSPLYFSFSSSFNRWEYGWESAYEAGTQKRSQTIAFSPALTFPLTALPWLTLNSSLSTNFIYYFQSYAPNTQTIVDEPLFSHNYAFNAEFLGPVFYKIFFGSDNTAKFKHIIEPTFTYRYESPTAFSDRIITTRFFYRNHYIRYGLTNHFLIKQDDMPREIFTLGLNQTFYLAPEDGPLKRYKVDGEIPKFSDIGGYLRFYPSSKYSIDFSAAFNPYYNTLSSLRLGVSLGSLEDSLFLRISWYKSINPYYKGTLWQRHQINCFGGVKIPRLSLEVQAEIDYNIQEREMLYSAFFLIYHYQCIDFKTECKIFYFREKPEVQFRISFGLGNIGKTTDFLGGLGF